MSALEIPWRQLSDDALAGVIEEFVSREGTEYGLRDVDLATKVAQVRRQLERGEVLVYFDGETSSCQLVHRDAAKRAAALSPDSSPAGGRGE